MVQVLRAHGFRAISVSVTSMLGAGVVCYYPDDPDHGHIFNLGDSISESKRNELGERNCSHRKIDGRVWDMGKAYISRNKLYDMTGKLLISYTGYIDTASIGDSGQGTWIDKYYQGYCSLTIELTCYDEFARAICSIEQFSEGQLVGYVSKQYAITYSNTQVIKKEKIATPLGRSYTIQLVASPRRINGHPEWASYAYTNRELHYVTYPVIVDQTYNRNSVIQGMKANAVTQAVDGLKAVDINSLAYLHDAGNLLADCKKLVKTVKSIKHPKEWANLWLSYRYGLRLFAQDTHEIIEGAKKHDASYRRETRFSRSRVRYNAEGISGYSTEITVCAKVYCRNVDMSYSNLYYTLQYLDLYPSFSNIWDFVPYSFVIDWLIPVGDALARVDAMRDIISLPILGATMSCKQVTVVSHPGAFQGDITVKSYDRNFIRQNSLLSTVSSLQGLDFLSGIFDVKHGIDALCLMLQRMR